MGKTREDGDGNGQAAQNTLEDKYNSHAEEAKRVYHEHLHNTNMKPGDDPADVLYTHGRLSRAPGGHATNTNTSLRPQKLAVGGAVMTK